MIESDWQLALRREVLLVRRQMGSWINGVCFFVLIGFVYQLLLGSGLELSSQLSISLIWVLALMSIMLVAEHWIKPDITSGYYDSWLGQGRSLHVLMVVKMLIQWLVNGGILALIVPLLAFQLGLEVRLVPWLMLSIFLGSLACMCFCGFGAVITAGQSQSGVLLSIVVVPLNLPPLIFGIGLVIAQAEDFNHVPILAVLIAISLLAIALLPFAMSFGAKIVNE